ncbi:MAG: 50S ribosomal protein L11 methyltransferase [Chitinispirillales bacterium]|jgi:ribosomal protein L11 methyltransferase|nr:50S ribosomal protein L11 methyltransferase [Chitinispirillales bacterium]
MYSLTCVITEDQQEIATAIGCCHNMGGCVEEQNGSDIKLVFYFENQDDAETAAESFANLLSLSEKTKIEFVQNQDWNAKWKETMEPAQIAQGVWVSPTWLEPPQEGRRAWIKIEPKMAFGTGHHETTRLAAQEIIARKNEISNKTVIDIGTGSGVLCFTANLAGAALALGVEIDSCCLENLAENLRDNPPAVGSNVNFLIGTLDSLNSSAAFDTVIMNMLYSESVPLLGQIKPLVKKGGLLIWSGILADEKNDVTAEAQKFGFKLTGSKTENEWWCGSFYC